MILWRIPFTTWPTSPSRIRRVRFEDAGHRPPGCPRHGRYRRLSTVSPERASESRIRVTFSHVHSQYGRTLLDLPLQGLSGRIELRTRRFYCRSKDGRRKIFTERFPSLTVAYARQTNRHSEVLNRVGYTLGWSSRIPARLVLRSRVQPRHDSAHIEAGCGSSCMARGQGAWRG